MDSPIQGYIGEYKRDIVRDYINYGSEVSSCDPKICSLNFLFRRMRRSQDTVKSALPTRRASITCRASTSTLTKVSARLRNQSARVSLKRTCELLRRRKDPAKTVSCDERTEWTGTSRNPTTSSRSRNRRKSSSDSRASWSKFRQQRRDRSRLLANLPARISKRNRSPPLFSKNSFEAWLPAAKHSLRWKEDATLSRRSDRRTSCSSRRRRRKMRKSSALWIAERRRKICDRSITRFPKSSTASRAKRRREFWISCKMSSFDFKTSDGNKKLSSSYFYKILDATHSPFSQSENDAFEKLKKPVYGKKKSAAAAKKMKSGRKSSKLATNLSISTCSRSQARRRIWLLLNLLKSKSRRWSMLLTPILAVFRHGKLTRKAGTTNDFTLQNIANYLFINRFFSDQAADMVHNFLIPEIVRRENLEGPHRERQARLMATRSLLFPSVEGDEKECQTEK